MYFELRKRAVPVLLFESDAPLEAQHDDVDVDVRLVAGGPSF